MGQTNLLQETARQLTEHGKSGAGVLWVGSRDGKRVISWDDFVRIADFTYDNGFGGQEVASDLVVVGNGWWLERHEYDGAEGWEFKTTPQREDAAARFTTVRNGNSWATVEEMNRPGGKYWIDSDECEQ